ncbi:MAG: NAD-dependent epimerase/dehydratase family protein [Bacteroidia bacterium]
MPETIIDDPRVQVIRGDIRDEKTIRNLLKPPVDAIFHLAAIVSGEAEKNFDLGMGVNLHATLQMLEICREYGQKPVFIFAGSCASFGGDYVIIFTITPQHHKVLTEPENHLRPAGQ